MTSLGAALRRATAAGASVRLYASPDGEIRINVVRRRHRSPAGRYEAAQSYALPDEFGDEELARAVGVAYQQLELEAFDGEGAALVYDAADHLLRRP